MPSSASLPPRPPGDDTTEQTGRLTTGFGASSGEIGPEFTFGIYMEKALKEPILLIKTSWGGKSLHTDFRPPGAGPYIWSDYELKQFKRRGDDIGKSKAETAPFWDDELETLQERMEACWPKVDAKVAEEKNDSWDNKMKQMAENFTPAEWKRMKGASNGGYLYLGAAKIMAPIGKSFAEAVVAMPITARR